MKLLQWLKRKSAAMPAQKNRARLAIELLEDRIQPSAGVRSIDGTGNNLAHPTWGAAGTDLIRIAPSAYADKISSPSGTNRPSARDISNTLSDQTDPNDPTQDLDVVNNQHLSDFIYVFGQFLDHDLDLTGGGSEAFNIVVDQAGDPFNPPGVMPFTRSEFDPATGKTTPRQQITEITSFIDGSQIYGSNDALASSLRTHVGGHLKTSVGNMLPYDNADYFGSSVPSMANDAHIVADGQLFAAGDVRANENIELTSMQTLFIREHNRLADQIAAAHPSWSDEQIYQQARSLVIAELQAITYNEFLPALVGAMPAYTGYNPNVNPTISNEFSTAMFRFAHSQLDNEVDRVNNNGTDIADGSVDLAEAFFNPTLLNPAGVTDPFSGHVSSDIDPILKGVASGDAQEVDLLAVRDIRNLLFGPPGAGGSDLIARDIQRGRDHGLTDYNSMRAAYGLPRVTSFAQITKDVAVQQKLKDLYGNVNNIDAFVGTLAEDHVPGADVGPLTRAVIVNQFMRLRAGDRFWYQRMFYGAQLNALNHTTLADVIRRNTGVTNIQDDVFHFRTEITGQVFLDRAGLPRRLDPGLQGITVQLLDTDGNVVASTLTGIGGCYHFVDVGLGTYTVQVKLPTGFIQTTPAQVVDLTRGQTVSHIDLGLRKAPAAANALTTPVDQAGTLGKSPA